MDYDLDDDYYVLYGHGNGEPEAGALGFHGGGDDIPSISDHPVNPVTDTGAQGEDKFKKTKQILIQTHGILMLIAWPLLGSTGIFFAAYMRMALPGGEWFQVHRAFMLGSLFIASVAFTLIYFSQLHSSTPGLISLTDVSLIDPEGGACMGGGQV